MRHKLRLFVSILLLSVLDGVIVCVAQQAQVEPMEKTPVFRANVVTRTTKAVDYRPAVGLPKSISGAQSSCRKPQARQKWKARPGAWKSMRN